MRLQIEVVDGAQRDARAARDEALEPVRVEPTPIRTQLQPRGHARDSQSVDAHGGAAGSDARVLVAHVHVIIKAVGVVGGRGRIDRVTINATWLGYVILFLWPRDTVVARLEEKVERAGVAMRA